MFGQLNWSGLRNTALLLLIPATASAQLANAAFKTVRTTDITAVSMCVGCPTGSTTPTDNSGVTLATLAVKSTTPPSSPTGKLYNSAGQLSWSGGGIPILNATSNIFSAAATPSVSLGIRNTTAGTTNTAFLQVGNDADANAGYMRTFSSLFTTSGIMIADATEVANERAGGLVIHASLAGAPIRFGFNGTERGRMFGTGGFSWGDTTDPGATNFRVAGTTALVGTVTHSGTTVMTGSVSLGGTNITDSVGTPTISGGGFGSGGGLGIVGKDYAFRVLTGTSTLGTNGQVNFSITYPNAPVCVGNSSSAGAILIFTGTASVNIGFSQGSSTAPFPAGMTIYVICRSF